jgi:transcriptional regulator with XRE-family HTH domain
MKNRGYAVRQLDNQKMTVMAISDEEHEFFIQLGARIAESRKSQGITQIQMAEILGVSQQTINSYEVGRRRVPVSTLSTLARTLSISIEDLLGEASNQPTGKRGPAPKLQKQFEMITQMPRTKQQFVMNMLDMVIQQSASQE